MKSQMNCRMLGIASLLVGAASISAAAQESSVSVVWSASAPEQSLQGWDAAQLSRLKSQGVSENGDAWKGVPLSAFVEKALGELSPEKRAQVDLLVLRNAQGRQAIIPRYFVTKFPVLLALQKNRKPLEAPSVVVPASSQPKVSGEGLPLEAYGLDGVTRLELASYKQRYSSLFLKRRTDPAAIRGEKMFLHNCVSCHDSGRARSVTEVAGGAATRALASSGHPEKPGVPKLVERDIRALVSYLDAYRGESSHAEAQSGTVQR